MEGDKPYHTGSNISLVGALELSGITAIMMVEGAVDGVAKPLHFRSFLLSCVLAKKVSGHSARRQKVMGGKIGYRVWLSSYRSPD